MVTDLLAAGLVPPYASAQAWARFRAKAVPTRRHALWLGAISDGYGCFHDPNYGDQDLEAGQRSGIVRVSRWMWWAWHGPIPSRLVVMHRCGDLPICVRLECLELGTQADNLRMAAGRNRVARRGAGGRLDVADRRGQAAQSRAIRAVARASVAAGGTDPDLLDGIVANVIAAGDPRLPQLPLFA